MQLQVTRWRENRNTASVHLGPLTFSLKIGEKYARTGGTDKWPAWEIHPTTPWNYGLVLDSKEATREFEVVRNKMPDAVPIEIRARVKRIPNWQLDERGLVGLMQPSPIKSDEPIETAKLIPMGAARLRITAFPVIGDGPGAREWPAPVVPDRTRQ